MAGTKYSARSTIKRCSGSRSDTIGDPFENTSGPSMNLYINLMSIVRQLIAPPYAKGGKKFDRALPVGASGKAELFRAPSGKPETD